MKKRKAQNTLFIRMASKTQKAMYTYMFLYVLTIIEIVLALCVQLKRENTARETIFLIL